MLRPIWKLTRTAQSGERIVIVDGPMVDVNLTDTNCASAAFIDFCKDVDAVHNRILIPKVINRGIKGLPLEWFDSYLSERKQLTMAKGI